MKEISDPELERRVVEGTSDPEMERRVRELEAHGSLVDFDAVSWAWLLILGIVCPVLLLLWGRS